MTDASNLYHHGNLRQSLLENSLQLLCNEGIEGLSLRRLAELTGVSRAAPYHHFKDKQALLAAVAEQGFAGASLKNTQTNAVTVKHLHEAGVDALREARV